tara:strand:- start:342 stop:920 length:579 start_codon:yes stop_codon:yes gene_type:complete
MKKIFTLLISMLLLTGCAETIALLGPASSILGGGNIVNSSISSAASYGVKKTTGKSPVQHAMSYAEKNNPNNHKDRCISSIKQTESEACYIAKKQISSVKKSASKKIKNIVNLSNIKGAKKTKLEQELPSKVEAEKVKVKKIKRKIVTIKKVKTEQEIKLRSVESMLVKSALNKKQISHLRVSIEKNSRIKD